MKKKVIKHLKDDMKMFKEEAKEDKALMKDIKKKSPENKSSKVKKAFEAGEAAEGSKLKNRNKKITKVMHEFKEKKLRSGSKKGPKVTSRAQALAIGYSEARKAAKKKKKK